MGGGTRGGSYQKVLREVVTLRYHRFEYFVVTKERKPWYSESRKVVLACIQLLHRKLLLLSTGKHILQSCEL